MANDNRRIDRANKRIQSIAGNVQNNMDTLYTTTYFSTPQASNDIKNIAQDINDNIDRIVSRNMDTIGMPSVSVLYSRIFNKNGATVNGNAITNGISKMFEDPMMMDDLYSTYMSNRFLKELDQEIDTVCKYMTELEEALETKKDSVLSADHFSKDFLNVKFPTDIENEKFSQRITELKKKYKLQVLAEEIYEDTAKYGEKFIYIVPYSMAITKLLMQKPQTSLQKPYMRMESFTEADIQEAVKENKQVYLFRMKADESAFIDSFDHNKKFEADAPTIIRESVEVSPSTGKKTTTTKPVSILSNNESFNISVEINTSGIIDSAINEAMAKIKSTQNRTRSLRELYMESVLNNNNTSGITEDKNPKASGNLNFNNVMKQKNTDISTDGLVSSDLSAKDIKQYKVDVPGAVVKYLKRETVIPIYIEQSCMGYYYIEFKTKDISDEMMGFRNLLGDPLTGMSGDSRANFNNIDAARQEDTIKYVAGQLSQFIDKKFVNLNQDLSKEIYEILKFNDLFNTPSVDQIKITFIPPEDIHHSYFTLDEEIHRGISDLGKGLIPAKLYASLYVTNSIGLMTRGQDKRVYYVNQTVDTNIASQLLNVIAQIKQGNFGIRQFNSINNVLNITGTFNDYVIPRTASGQAPIDIDVIQGQQFDVHTDLMDILKEMAINSTGVPLEIIQTRQSVDYASQLSMSSSKFLRTIYKRQEKFQNIMSPIISAIYNYEYGDTIELEVTLPPPIFLDMVNTNQLIDNTKNFVDSIIDVEMGQDQSISDEVKSKYRQNLFMHYIGTHIDISAHKQILDMTKVQIKEEQKESEVAHAEAPPEEEGGDDYGF